LVSQKGKKIENLGSVQLAGQIIHPLHIKMQCQVQQNIRTRSRSGETNEQNENDNTAVNGLETMTREDIVSLIAATVAKSVAEAMLTMQTNVQDLLSIRDGEILELKEENERLQWRIGLVGQRDFPGAPFDL